MQNSSMAYRPYPGLSTWAPPRAKGHSSTRPWGRRGTSIILGSLRQEPSKSLITSQYNLVHLLLQPREEGKHYFYPRYIHHITSRIIDSSWGSLAKGKFPAKTIIWAQEIPSLENAYRLHYWNVNHEVLRCPDMPLDSVWRGVCVCACVCACHRDHWGNADCQHGSSEQRALAPWHNICGNHKGGLKFTE